MKHAGESDPRTRTEEHCPVMKIKTTAMTRKKRYVGEEKTNYLNLSLNPS